jgi:hypothetical protein
MQVLSKIFSTSPALQAGRPQFRFPVVFFYFFIGITLSGESGSTVGIVTDYGLEGSGIE